MMRMGVMMRVRTVVASSRDAPSGGRPLGVRRSSVHRLARAKSLPSRGLVMVRGRPSRRAQAANWLLYYRRELRGVPIEELKRRREERRKREEAEQRTDAPTGTTKQGVV